MIMEDKNTPSFGRTELSRKYYVRHFNETLANVLIAGTVLAFLVALMPLLSALFLFTYVLLIFVVSAFLVIFTVGLIFTIENNIVVRMWSVLDKIDVDYATKLQAQALPWILGIMAVTFAIVLVLTILDKAQYKKSKFISILIVSGIFLLIALIVFIIVQAGK